MLIVVLLMFFLAVPVWAEEKGWEKEWNQTLAAARREGKVVVFGPADPVVRRRLPATFKAKFGISVEYMSGRTRLAAGRFRRERRARHYSTDVFMAGTGTFGTILYPERMLDPLKPELILPEVVDPSKWKKGKLWFMDPDGKYVLRLFNYLGGSFYVNTRYVKPEEFNSIKEFLNPRWKGKISIVDPSRGQGAFYAAIFYVQMGEEFVKKLYVDQKPVFSTNSRQMADWLARGTYPISLGAGSENVKRLQKEGFPVKGIEVPDMQRRVVAGNGNVAIMNKAPHPKAARVFVNWIASREGLEFLSRVNLKPTTRNDVDESFLTAEEIPLSDVNYFDGSGWSFTAVEVPKVRRQMGHILRR